MLATVTMDQAVVADTPKSGPRSDRSTTTPLMSMDKARIGTLNATSANHMRATERGRLACEVTSCLSGHARSKTLNASPIPKMDGTWATERPDASAKS